MIKLVLNAVVITQKYVAHVLAVEAANGRYLYDEIKNLTQKPKTDDIVLFRNENKLTGRKMTGHAKNSASSESESIGPSPVDSNNVSLVKNSSKKNLLPYLSKANRLTLNLIQSLCWKKA